MSRDFSGYSERVSAAHFRHFTLQDPGRFLRALSAAEPDLDVRDVTLTEMWSLTAMAARARVDGRAPLRVTWDDRSPARMFATAVGFDEVVAGTSGGIRGDEGRTVRLSRVAEEASIQPVALEIGRLLAGERPEFRTARDVIEYVVKEALRNVLQHSDDLLGAVVGAQRNDRGLHSQRPVYQVSIADSGVGIRATLGRTHPDVQDDDVALEQALWPYHSGAFAPGGTGGLENAGLGLFYISEMAKELGGRMLLSSGSASILVDPGLPLRIARLNDGFSPGTLVAFEVPTEVPEDFPAIFDRISAMARERSPGRVTQGWLRFDSPPEKAQRFVVSTFVENNEEALRLAQDRLIPRLIKKEPVVLDFVNIRIITQSFAHALLFEPLRFAWASKTPIFVVNTQPVVRSALYHVEQYAQSG